LVLGLICPQVMEWMGAGFFPVDVTVESVIKGSDAGESVDLF